MNNETLPQYDEILNSCRAIFEKKKIASETSGIDSDFFLKIGVLRKKEKCCSDKIMEQKK